MLRERAFMNPSRETRDQRVRRYIKHAAEARDLAAQSMPLSTKEDCLIMAESWLAMALDCEARGGAAGAEALRDSPEALRDGPEGVRPDATA
jgi:hypothetical protein